MTRGQIEKRIKILEILLEKAGEKGDPVEMVNINVQTYKEDIEICKLALLGLKIIEEGKE